MFIRTGSLLCSLFSLLPASLTGVTAGASAASHAVASTACQSSSVLASAVSSHPLFICTQYHAPRRVAQ